MVNEAVQLKTEEAFSHNEFDAPQEQNLTEKGFFFKLVLTKIIKV